MSETAQIYAFNVAHRKAKRPDIMSQGRACTLVVSWLPGNLPRYSKEEGAHRKAALTPPTNKP